MSLSEDIISQYLEVNVEEKAKKEETLLGTIVSYNGKQYVKLDGSDQLTPIDSTSSVDIDDRVTVLLKNHTAIVTGNLSDPSAKNSKMTEISDRVDEFGNIMAYSITTENIDAINAYFKNLTAITAKYENMESVNAEIERLQATYANLDHVTAEDVKALNADIENLKATFLEATSISTEDLDAANAEINNLKAYNANFTYVSADVLSAINGKITNLDATYANIDFANITEAAVGKIFSDSGIIKDIVVSEGRVTGELVGVTIKGDIIEGGTVKADKLVVKGSDGLYYKLNTEGGATTSEQISEEDLQNGLSGSIIVAKSITAEKVAVKDLVAFGATIGGFHITNSSIYSGDKTEPTNTTTGVYFDKYGQMTVGDATNFIKYYKDQNGVYKLEISADSILFGSSKKSVETELTEVETTADTAKSTAETAQSTANAAKSTADGAKSTADTAKTTANAAQSTAETAQSTANTAKTTADTAKSTADTAKSTADGAQEGINSLTAKVTNAETIIKQNSEAITLRATSESVSKDITDTNSKITKLQAQFDVQAKSIASLIRNGETGSLLKQDAEDLYFFDISGLETSLSENADEIKKTNESISKISNDTEYLKTKTEYIAVGTDDNDKPYIELGEGDSKFKVKITNEQIEFKDGASTPAYITNQKLMIENAKVNNELRFGPFAWKKRSNGNLGIIWEGETS